MFIFVFKRHRRNTFQSYYVDVPLFLTFTRKSIRFLLISTVARAQVTSWCICTYMTARICLVGALVNVWKEVTFKLSCLLLLMSFTFDLDCQLSTFYKNKTMTHGNIRVVKIKFQVLWNWHSRTGTWRLQVKYCLVWNNSPKCWILPCNYFAPSCFT